MTRDGINLKSIVRRRAKERCEYCMLPERLAASPFEIDHIIAQQHGGATSLENLAFACFADNHHKGPNLGGIDPRTGKRTWLFHPRLQEWDRHFRWEGAILFGKTPIGRTTIAVLQINLRYRVEHRTALIEEKVFFSSDDI